MIPVYVINLDRQPERWARLSRNAHALDLPLTRVRAIDRQTEFGPDLLREHGQRDAARYGPLTPGEVCCGLGHMRIWRRLAESDAPAALVLEDDAVIAPQIHAFLGAGFLGLLKLHDLTCVKLEYHHVAPARRGKKRPLGRALDEVPGAVPARLYRLLGPFLGTGAYLLTREGAQDLLRRHDRLYWPVDQFMFDPVVGLGFRTLRTGFVNPAPVLHDQVGLASDLNADKLDQSRANPGVRVTPTRDLRYRLRIETAGLRRALHKVTGARPVEPAFLGTLPGDD